MNQHDVDSWIVLVGKKIMSISHDGSMGLVYLHIFTYLKGDFLIVNVGKCTAHGSCEY